MTGVKKDLSDSSHDATVPADSRSGEIRATALVQGTGATYTEGQIIGEKYRLVRRLGEGGMASVWVAHNEPLDIEVAIKFIRADLQHAGLTSRLLQEARAAARLGHSAIVRVSDFGKTPVGDPYIVMELLNGEDLGASLKRKGPLPAAKAVRTLLPIADALAVAHNKKIVHRDLKPENIFVCQTEDGKTQPKLVDFGIAKLEREDTQRITQLGSAMGSPAYMSPEQARGLDVDARTDIWALSVVLYEVTTGKLPFTGNTYTALVCSILESKPQPLHELGVGDPELWQIVERGLEKEPDKRWQSMRELATALARWLMARGVNEDVTGSSLHSSWVERLPDSYAGGTVPTQTPPPTQSDPRAAQAISGTGSGHIATQLAATIGGSTKKNGKSPVVIAGIAGAAILLIGAGVLLKVVASGKAEPESRPAASGTVTSSALPTASAAGPVVAPTAIETAAPPPSAEPSAKPSKPTHAGTAKPATKPGKPEAGHTKPPEEKPPVTPPTKPPTKPPDDIKTEL